MVSENIGFVHYYDFVLKENDENEITQSASSLGMQSYHTESSKDVQIEIKYQWD